MLGIIILCFSGIGLAGVLLRRLSFTLSQAKALLEFVFLVRNSVENYSMPLAAIFERCPRELLETCGYRYPDRVPHSLSEFFLLCEIRDVCIGSVLDDFSSDFGKNYRARQSESCDACIERLRKRVGELEAALPDRRKAVVAVAGAGTLIIALLLL